jgi:UDP-N-acetylglucosamine 1-carboxyvinyltransferase
MADLIIDGGKQLSGTISPSGNKNSVLPILCASLLAQEPVVLKNVPDLTDVQKLVETMISIGVKIDWDKQASIMKIDNSQVKAEAFNNNFPLGMRGAVLLLPPLLLLAKKLIISDRIGGCTLGIREIDPHLQVLQSLGAKISNGNKLELELKNGFRATELWLDYMSVTTTENFILGTVLAQGKSKIVNAASEPHVQDLCHFLNQMGAKISGIGSSTLEIEGVNKLKGVEFTVSSDHHEIATFLALGAMTNGQVKVTNILWQHFSPIQNAFSKLGVEIKKEKDMAVVNHHQQLKIKPTFTPNLIQKIEAAPWPYFPVDLLPLMIALATQAEGEIMFWNKVYEAGFFWIAEMVKFGAQIIMADPHRVIAFGNRPLQAAEVDAPDVIRATTALAMTALAIPGKSIVKSADPIKRAHPNFVQKLESLGAKISWQN